MRHRWQASTTSSTVCRICRLARSRISSEFTRDEEEYWSSELCFVPVPIKGQKRDTIHLIDEDLAMDYLPSGKIKRFRLVLATKPFDMFFFIEMPSTNLDNGWNISAISAVEQAQDALDASLEPKGGGYRLYKVDKARSQEAFPEPRWPKLSLEELINKTFMGRMIITRRSSGSAASYRRQAVPLVSNFSNTVVCDFEYEVVDGGMPNVLCMVAYVLDEGLRHVRTIRMWRGHFGDAPPFDTGPDTLVRRLFRLGGNAMLHGAQMEVPGPYLRPSHLLSRSLQYSAARTIQTKFANGSASACRMRVAPT